MKDPIRTISRYLDHDLPDGELQELVDWIEASENNAALFAKVSQFDSDLRDELGLLSQLPPPQESPATIAANMVLFPEEEASNNDWYRRLGVIAALIALSLVLWQLFPAIDPPQPQEAAPNTIAQQPIGQPAEDKPVATEPVVAMITRSRQADRRYSEGVTLKPGHYALEQGSVEIQMLRGALVIIQAPSRFELIDDNQIYLTKGKVTADVPEEARFFTVQTPSMTLVDLGTRFGAEVKEDGSATAAVFDGEVIAHESAPGDKPTADGQSNHSPSHSLKTGDTINASLDAGIDATISKLAPDHGFHPTWRDLIGHVQVAGQARFFIEPPTDIGPTGLIDTKNIIVFREKNETLQAPTKVKSSFNGYTREVSYSTLPRGTRVMSYLIHFSPGEERAEAKATLRFPGRVLGLIANHEDNLIADGLFALEGVDYWGGREATFKSSIDFGTSDRFTITGDQQNVLEITLSAYKLNDRARVLIDMPDESTR